MSNPYLHVLATPRYGILGAALLAYVGGRVVLAAAAAAYAKYLNKAYNTEGALKLEAAVAEVDKAIKQDLLPDGWRQAGISGNAWKAPASEGDALVKSAYWMALASRVLQDPELAKRAQKILLSVKNTQYSNRKQADILSVLGRAGKIVDDAGRIPAPALNAGELRADVKGIVGPGSVFSSLAKQPLVEAAQARRIDPSGAAKETWDSTSPDALAENAAEGAAKGAKGMAKSFLPDWMMGNDGKLKPWILPTTAVVTVGGFILASQRRRQDLMTMAFLARGGKGEGVA
jgi:hypothetical protein